MQTAYGKLLIRFNAAAIEGHDKVAFNGSQLQIMRPNNPNDYTLETAYVAHTSRTQQFFAPGQRVLVDYAIFQLGKFRAQVKTTPRYFGPDPGGDGELYYCFDGQDGWNRTEVYGVFQTDGSLLMHPTRVLVERPKEGSWRTQGKIVVLDYEDRDKHFWVRVIAAHPETGLQGKKILVAGGHAQPIYYDGKEAALVEINYILAYHDTEPQS